jgi:hypothetical protein
MNIFNNFFRKKLSKISKRYRLILSVLILTLLFLFSTFFFFDKAIIFVPLLLIGSFLAVLFVIFDEIYSFGYFTFFFMPTFLSLIFYLFYFLFPGRWLTRFPFVFFYAVSLYANLLITNIFYIGVEKNLQLYRAAFSVNFLYQNILAFFFFNVLFSFHQTFLINMIFSALVVFALAIHLFWSIRLKKYLEKRVLDFSILLAVIIAEVSFVISIVPVRTTVAALFLTAVYYSLAGIFYHYLDNKLFKETIREYLIVLIFVFIITVLTLSW